MTIHDRSDDIAQTFVRLADTLVDDYDVVDFASTLSGECLRLLDVDAAGVMLVAGPDDLRLLASSSEDARALELFELQVDEGPCIDAYRTGSTVDIGDLSTQVDKWGRFASYALQAGFHSVAAIPMSVRLHRMGALNLFNRVPRQLPTEDLALARALADIASIGILTARSFQEQLVLAEQLQRALTSRVVIEQAKGVLAERLGLPINEAFTKMRAFARSNRKQLSDVASDVVSGEIAVNELDGEESR